MSAQAWLNGELLAASDDALVTNRGLHYGDGLFETMLVRDGRIRLLDGHLQRLFDSCDRLQMSPPPRSLLLDELQRVATSQARGILKLLVTRGGAGRGYRPQPESESIRLMLLYPLSDAPSTLRVQWCDTRLSRNARLAGMKHLNRLEQVLAQQELRSDSDEGLMLDNDGELISATSGNVFIVNGTVLCTPDLLSSGVRGVMRGHVLSKARALGITVEERAVWPADLEEADEVFVTNAVRGIRAVISLHQREWAIGPMTQRLQQALEP